MSLCSTHFTPLALSLWLLLCSESFVLPQNLKEGSTSVLQHDDFFYLRYSIWKQWRNICKAMIMLVPDNFCQIYLFFPLIFKLIFLATSSLIKAKWHQYILLYNIRRLSCFFYNCFYVWGRKEIFIWCT